MASAPDVTPRHLGLRKSLRPRPADTILFPQGPAMHILIADDDPSNRELLTELLRHSGHSVTAVADGREALAAIRDSHFEVVLMDEEMPRLSGLDATRAILDAAKPAEKRPIIVGISGNADEDRCLAAGMDAFLAKPIRAAELFSILAMFARRSAPASQQGAAAAPGSEPSPASLRTHLDRTTGGDSRIAASLIKTFLADAPKKLQLIRRAIAESDAGALAAAAHTLKGALSLAGGGTAAGTARNLQAMGRLGNLSGAAAELAVLENEFDQLRRELLALQAKPETTGKRTPKKKSAERRKIRPGK